VGFISTFKSNTSKAISYRLNRMYTTSANCVPVTLYA